MPEKINKMPEFFSLKNIFPEFWGISVPLPPVSYAYVQNVMNRF